MQRHLTLAARLLLGLCYVLFGANGLLLQTTGKGFIPLPPPSPAMAEVMSGFFQAVYLMPLVKTIELFAGLLLILGLYPRIALILLTPITVNILGIHLFLEPAALPMSAFLVICSAWLIRSEWKGGFDQLLLKEATQQKT